MDEAAYVFHDGEALIGANFVVDCESTDALSALYRAVGSAPEVLAR